MWNSERSAGAVMTAAEIAEHLDGHLHIRLGDEFAGDGQLYSLGAGWCGHQQTAEELAADVAVDRRGASVESSGGSIDADRRAGAVGVFEGDAGPSCRRVCTRSPMGRCRMRSTPSRR
jgi:hypothetical protein